MKCGACEPDYCACDDFFTAKLNRLSDRQMNRKDIKPWLPKATRDKDGTIWIEQPDGSLMECEPMRFQRWLNDCLSVLCAAAWAKLTLVK